MDFEISFATHSPPKSIDFDGVSGAIDFQYII